MTLLGRSNACDHVMLTLLAVGLGYVDENRWSEEGKVRVMSTPVAFMYVMSHVGPVGNVSFQTSPEHTTLGLQVLI